MAYLTEGQKSGIANLLQDWPIGDAIDYDRVQSMSTYEPPESLGSYERSLLSNPNFKGFVHGVGVGTDEPPGNPSGIGKEYGADPGIYVRDIDKFQPEWTPGATEEGRVNRKLADVVGHEGRHMYFENNPELFEDINVTALGNNPNVANEELNLWLDMVAGGKGISQSDLFQNRLLTRYMMMDRPGEGRLGITGLQDIFRKATMKFRKHRVDDRNRKFVEMLKNRRAGPPAARPKETYVSPARPHGGGRDFQPQRPDKPGGFTDPGKGSYGPHKAKGGIIDKPLPGRSRDI